MDNNQLSLIANLLKIVGEMSRENKEFVSLIEELNIFSSDLKTTERMLDKLYDSCFEN